MASLSPVVSRAEEGAISVAFDIAREYYEEVGVINREDLQSFEDAYFGPRSAFFLAWSGTSLAGCGALRPLPTVGPDAAEIKRLYVRPAYRGLGIAAALLRAIEDFAAGESFAWLYLDTKDDLDAAIRFYRRNDYVDCERYNNNQQATLFMRKRLRSADKSERVSP
jgi:GNAT superfamily N-acetyltransferase